MELQPISPFVQHIFRKYEAMRPCFMSEGHFLNQFLMGKLLSDTICHR